MKRIIIALALCISFSGIVLIPQPVHATVITDAVVEMTGLDPLSKWVVKLLLDQILGDHRGAATDARVGTSSDPHSGSASFFGDTGLITSSAADANGSGSAKARNKLRGKVVQANASGDNAAANAAIDWKGDVKFSADTKDPTSSPTKSPAVALPAPGEVTSAKLIITYEVEFDANVDSNDQGVFGIEHSWNGEKTFEGGVSMMSTGLPEFTGDLVSYQSSFTNTEDQISGSLLTITDVYEMPIDYSDFYNSGEVTTSFSGSMFASASASGDTDDDAPEPATLLLMIFGLMGMGVVRKR